MNYPDGIEVKVGDLIWVNEGTQIGRVAEIIDSAEKRAAWGLDEDGIFISLDPMAIRLCSGLFNSEEQFEDEGIGLLTGEEWAAERKKSPEERLW